MTPVLTHDQQQAAALYLGIPLAALQAVQEVEARSHGFLPDGRPALLFERHIMYRQLKNHGLDADRLAQTYPDLVNKSAGGYQGGSREHYRLNLAKQIHSAAAIESASWGLFQIMGFHWKALDYASAADFEKQMSESEQMQLDAFVRFIEANPKIHDAMKTQNWPEFARRYNGPQYKRNQYDVKLAVAFEKFSKAAA
ncbi:N-acetylmuramidase family protein [Salmonella enterica]|nr:N-acetylmuramidase family protein [Salmonella enterica]EEG6732939.1 N-acetylmuramidase family protein [Salmonella enterica]EFR2063242.1 N-acetylmuramidase family protein [Salmonella enterica]EFV0356148.1 N-acetylmuramidase family protein [Salmonella enterica]EGB1974396.1 N-acetylmuramidase family protein [Salmonella enterica]